MKNILNRKGIVVKCFGMYVKSEFFSEIVNVL